MIDINTITNQIINADCMDILKELPDKCIDAIICDLPYGTTACSWDVIIPFDKLWEQYKRIRKDNTPIILFGCEPFSSLLRCSNLKEYKYDWIWDKKKGLGFLDSKFRPLKTHENISIFSKGGCSNGCTINMTYNPQGLVRIDKRNSNTKSELMRFSAKNKYLNMEYTNFPKSILTYTKESFAFHPTQKPVALLEYLIKTYSNEGDLILDNCSGSGSLAIAAYNTKRRFICIEKDKDYYDASIERLKNAQAQLRFDFSTS